MQTGSEHLKAQQEIMAAKNMYNGKIDGIWGPKSIAAKQKWERSGKFSPGIPNNGFPLNDRAPLPSGVIRKADGTLACLGLPTKPTATSTAQTPTTLHEAPHVASAVEPVVTEVSQAQPAASNNQQRHGSNQQKPVQPQK